jgi:hypothetical protein
MSRKNIKPINKQVKPIINRGTGAGGSNTNHNGLEFEKLTNSEHLLLANGFVKKIMNKNINGYYLIKEIKSEAKKDAETVDLDPKSGENTNSDNNNECIIYCKQSGFREYINKFIDSEINVYYNPDEAFLIKKGDNYHLKIIEKKNQNGEGSVEEKLKLGPFLKEDYEMMLEKIKDKIKIDYSYCVSEFLKNKINSKTPKYINFNRINEKHNIKIFYGNDVTYLKQVYKWITGEDV